MADDLNTKNSNTPTSSNLSSVTGASQSGSDQLTTPVLPPTPSLDSLLLQNQKLVQFGKRNTPPPTPAPVLPASQSNPSNAVGATQPINNTVNSGSVSNSAPKTLQQMMQVRPATAVTPTQPPATPSTKSVTSTGATTSQTQTTANPPKIPPPVIPVQSQERKFSSSVRTMRDDIELLKKGVLSVPTKPAQISPIVNTPPVSPVKPSQAPAPIIPPASPVVTPIVKPQSPIPPASPAPTLTTINTLSETPLIKIAEPAPVPTPVTNPIKPAEIKSPIIMPEPTIPTIPNISPASPVSTPPTPPKPVTPTIPNLSGGPTLPPSRGGSSVGIQPLYIVIIVVLVAVLGIGIYFIATSGGNGGSTQTATPKPNTSIAVSPTPIDQGSLSASFSALSLKIKSEDSLANLKALLRSYNAQEGQLVAFSVQDVTTTQNFSLSGFLNKFGVSVPNDQTSGALNTQDFIYGFFAQPNLGASTDGKNVILRPYIVAKINDLQSLQQLLQIWEPSLEVNFSQVMDYEVKNLSFSQDFVNGTPFRYLPDSEKGLAYTIIGQYLVITSSRDSFRAVTSKVFSLINSNLSGNNPINNENINGSLEYQ